MYSPRTFRESEPGRLLGFLEEYSFGLLIAVADDGSPEIAPLPFLIDRGTGPHGALRCHVARPNRIWQLARDRPVTAVFQGPHGYVSPRWYGRPDEEVPTWNYVAMLRWMPPDTD
jgi:transcriptional regulator